MRRRAITEPSGLLSTASTNSPGVGKPGCLDPAPGDWVEPKGPMESFGFDDWPGVGVVYAD